MKNVFAKSLVGVLFFTLTISFFPALNVQAAGASLYLSPSTGTYSVGDTFAVKVILNSGGGAGVNASEGSIEFDRAYLSVNSVSKGGSVFSLWTSDPAFSNADGTITYSGGSPRASAPTGSAGTILSASFTVLKAGSGGITFSSAKALANDGTGTNILSNTSGAQFTFIAKAAPPAGNPAASAPASSGQTAPASQGVMPPVPEINSATHPNPDIWYANNNPEFTWKLLPDISTVSFIFDQFSSTDPGKKSDGIMETKAFSKVADGRNYFHLKFQNKAGWGPVGSRQILIDTVPPTNFVVNVDNSGDPTDPSPKLSFTTVDVTSGIADYKFNLDGEIKDLPAADYLKNPYQLPILRPGTHHLIVAVADQAGNAVSSSRQFLVEALKPPVITDMPSGINEHGQLTIQGTSFYPGASITIFISPDDKNIKTLSAKTDSDGNWAYMQPSDLGRNNYHLWAIVTDSRGAQSSESARKTLLIQSPSLVESYGLWIIIFLLLAVVFLILLMILLNHQYKVKKARALRETQELEKRTNEIFTALKEEVNELMELADKKSGFSESEKRVRDKINEALDISQEFISKEVKDVKKEIE